MKIAELIPLKVYPFTFGHFIMYLFLYFRSTIMAVLFPLGAVIVCCLFLLTFSERFSVSRTGRKKLF